MALPWEALETGPIIAWETAAVKMPAGLGIAYLQEQSGLPYDVCRQWHEHLVTKATKVSKGNPYILGLL